MNDDDWQYIVMQLIARAAAAGRYTQKNCAAADVIDPLRRFLYSKRFALWASRFSFGGRDFYVDDIRKKNVLIKEE